MDKVKINDFVDVWAKTIGLTEARYINVIKNDIIKRCTIYEKISPTVSIEDDYCKAYIIKDVNGKYSIEDFFLNRLMLGLREVDFSGALEGHSGEYVGQDKTLNVNVGFIDSKISDKATRHSGLKGKNVQIIKKTIEHELGHCFKTQFNDGFKAPFGNRKQDEVYKALINNLANFENGKYARQIKGIEEFNLEEYSNKIKTGVRDSRKYYSSDDRIKWIDELLNEIEALELTNSNEIHEKWPLQDKNKNDSKSGNYVNVYNYLSGYATITGYGDIFKTILGKKDAFHAEYISSVEVFKKFDEEYADIVYDVWGLDPAKISPIECLYQDFHDLINKRIFDEEIMLKLDEFFAKCFERRVDSIIAQNNGIVSKEIYEQTFKKIEEFGAKLTTNDDKQKRDSLAHNIVFNNIKAKLNTLITSKGQNSATNDDIEILDGVETLTINKSSNMESLNVQSIVDIINPELLKKMMKLPNGREISAKQYIQEAVYPYLPQSGRVTLSNGANLSVKQFIEECVIFDCQERYNGDIKRYMSENTINSVLTDVNTDKKIPAVADDLNQIETLSLDDNNITSSMGEREHWLDAREIDDTRINIISSKIIEDRKKYFESEFEKDNTPERLMELRLELLANRIKDDDIKKDSDDTTKSSDSSFSGPHLALTPGEPINQKNNNVRRSQNSNEEMKKQPQFYTYSSEQGRKRFDEPSSKKQDVPIQNVQTNDDQRKAEWQKQQELINQLMQLNFDELRRTSEDYLQHEKDVQKINNFRMVLLEVEDRKKQQAIDEQKQNSGQSHYHGRGM